MAWGKTKSEVKGGWENYEQVWGFQGAVVQVVGFWGKSQKKAGRIKRNAPRTGALTVWHAQSGVLSISFSGNSSCLSCGGLLQTFRSGRSVSCLVTPMLAYLLTPCWTFPQWVGHHGLQLVSEIDIETLRPTAVGHKRGLVHTR